MVKYEIVHPVDSTIIEPQIIDRYLPYNRFGVDGNDKIIPFFASDYFVGEVLSRDWIKADDGTILDCTQFIDGGKFVITGKAASAGVAAHGWVQGRSQIVFRKNTEIDVHLKLSGLTSSDEIRLYFFLNISGTTVNPSWTRNLYFYLRATSSGYSILMGYLLHGSWAYFTDTITVTNNEGTLRIDYRKASEVHVYWHDGSGDVDETDDEIAHGDYVSPFDMSELIPENSVFRPSLFFRTTETTDRTGYSNFVEVRYPKKPIESRYELKYKDAVVGGATYFLEAEDGTLSGTAGTTDLDDDSDESVVLDAQNETVDSDIANMTATLPKGKYLAIARIKDTNHVYGDVYFDVNNATDATYMGWSVTREVLTVTGTYQTYEQAFEIDDDDEGDTLRFRIQKATATANTIYVDWFRIVPLTPNSNSCRVFDNNGSSDEDDWTEVFDPQHVFVGNQIIQNGQIRLSFEVGTYMTQPEIFWWNGVEWADLVDYTFWRIIDFESTTFWLTYVFVKHIQVISREKIVLVVRWQDEKDDLTTKAFIDVRITLDRGMYGYMMEPIEICPARTFDLASYNATAMRFGVQPDDSETHDIGDFDLSQDMNNTTLTNNYHLQFDDDDGTQRLVGTAFSCVPTYGSDRIRCYHGGNLYTESFREGDINALKIYQFVVPFSRLPSLYVEAEDETLGGGADTEDLADDVGESARLNAQNEELNYSFVAGTELPPGRYMALMRVEDTNQVASDLEMWAYNNTDSTWRNEEQTYAPKTCAATWGYKQIVFDITEDDAEDGDTLRVGCRKATATANTIYIDYILIIPISNGENWPQDQAHDFLRRVEQRTYLKKRAL